MSLVRALRDFINERLTAAAVEIFTVFERTIVQYEEELDRQRRLLDISWKPQTPLHRIEPPQQNVSQLQFYNQESSSSLYQNEPEPPQIKEEQEKPEPLLIKDDQDEPDLPQMKEEQEQHFTSQDGDQLVLNQGTDTCMETSTYEESDHCDPKPAREQLLFHYPPNVESQDQKGNWHVDSGSVQNAELKPKKRCQKTRNHSNNVDSTPLSESRCDTDTGTNAAKSDVCRKAFTDKDYMKKHHRFHTDMKMSSCEICGKVFRCRRNVLVHMRTHTGERPYSCLMCGKNFSQRNNLTVHMRIHTGEKPYSCETCGKNFRHGNSQRFHMRIHTGEKPYCCKRCGKSFTQNGNLTAHMRTHTGQVLYFCEICELRFKTSSALKIHQRGHTGENYSRKIISDQSLVGT